MEKMLNSMEEKYNVVIELLQEVIVSLDKDGNILEINRRFYDWLGYSQDEVVGKNILTLPFLTEKTITQIREGIFRESYDPEITGFEFDLAAKSGETLYGKMAFHRIKDESGNVIRIFIIVSDITRQKELETTLLESSEREDKAYQQGRQEIIDSILHNIGNSINSIMIGIGTIQGGLANNKFSRYLLSLADAVKAHQEDFGSYVENDPQGQKVIPFITALADDFAKYNSDLAKIADRVSDMAKHIGDIIQMDKAYGITKAYPDYINIRRLIYDAIGIFRDTLTEKNIKIITDCDSIPQHVNLSEDQVHQAVKELIGKSIESIDDIRDIKGANYTPFIRIKCYIEYESIILEATHNGIGVKREEISEVYQNTCETENKFRFSSISNLAKKLGGRVQISSNSIYEGATIRILLPFLI